MSIKSPIIGITLDWQEKGTFSTRPHYALREQYFSVIEKAGGTPIALPYEKNLVDNYLDIIDGLLIPGGFFATPSSWYIDNNLSSPYDTSPRLSFDLELVEKALDRNMPILGICAGMQIIGGLLGCKMTPDIHNYTKTQIDHINGAIAEEYCHDVIVNNQSLLYDLIGKHRFAVNSAHREAIIKESELVEVSAISEDGVIEAIEVIGKRFALGVQWHPEFFSDDGEPSFELIKEFVAISRN